MGVSIDPMQPSDLAAVIGLWRATEGVGLNEMDVPEHLRKYLDRNPGLSLVVRDGSQLVGAVLCGHDGRRGYLNHLAVVPEYRGRGIGRRIVERCLSDLQAIGILRCNIFLYADNEAGERFWQRCGWAPRSDLKVMQRSTSR